MQESNLDPKRPHGLDDILDRMTTEVPWRPSWADVCRVRDYVGGAWTEKCDNAYTTTHLVLYHLSDVRKACASGAPYVSVACAPHNAAIGDPCAHSSPLSFLRELPLPGIPLVCTWRVLAKHDRLSAMEIFERRFSAPIGAPSHSSGHDMLLIKSTSIVHPSTALETIRFQYRDPKPFMPECLVIANAANWTIYDMRVGGTSILAPHFDLPGNLFRNDVMGPRPSWPVIEQDQWIEIEARPLRERSLSFSACLIGTVCQEKTSMHESTDTLSLEKLQEQAQKLREQSAIEHLAACERVRKSLDLPIDVLPLIDKVLRDDPDKALRDDPASSPLPTFGRHFPPRTAEKFPNLGVRAPLRLQSETKIKPTDPITGMPTTVHVRPCTIAMRIEEIEILSNPDHWLVADVQVGNRTQFPQAGPPLSGRLFTPGGTCHHFVTEVIQIAMDFSLLVHYVGPKAEGDIFEAAAIGTLVY